MSSRKLAVVTGASSGIGLELAKCAAKDGYDLIVAADTPFVDATPALKDFEVQVHCIETDLSSQSGVDELLSFIGGREVDVLVANAAHGLGHAWLEQSARDWMHVINTNITGTLLLIQPLLRRMVERGSGKVLITGSVAGHLAGAFQAVYNGSKAFIDSFSAAIIAEIKGSGVTVTCLKPGLTETEFFQRADLEDTKAGQARKDDPADVAKAGWDAMKDGEATVIHGLKNKMQVAAASMLTDATTAKLHRAQLEPGSGSE